MKNGKKFNKWSIIFRLNPFIAPYKFRIIIGIIFGFLLLASDKFSSGGKNLTLQIGLLIGLAQILDLMIAG